MARSLAGLIQLFLHELLPLDHRFLGAPDVLENEHDPQDTGRRQDAVLIRRRNVIR